MGYVNSETLENLPEPRGLEVTLEFLERVVQMGGFPVFVLGHRNVYRFLTEYDFAKDPRFADLHYIE